LTVEKGGADALSTLADAVHWRVLAGHRGSVAVQVTPRDWDQVVRYANRPVEVVDHEPNRAVAILFVSGTKTHVMACAEVTDGTLKMRTT
jgi:hypothetical protein